MTKPTIRRAATAGTLALGLATATPMLSEAHAGTIAAPLTWAAFANAPTWQAPTDNVQWYVASPTITKAMIGKKVTLDATSPASIDCKAFGAGYATAKGTWHNLGTARATCSTTTLEWSFTATRAMVGSNVFLNAWSSVATGDATINGTVTIGKDHARSASTAKRPVKSTTTTTACASSTPIGPLVPIRNDGDTKAATASKGNVHEVWYGNTCYPAPSGVLLDDSYDLQWSIMVQVWVNVLDPKTKQVLHWATSDAETGATPTVTTSGPYPGSYYVHTLPAYHAGVTQVVQVPLDGSKSVTVSFPLTDNVTSATTDGTTTTISYTDMQTSSDATCTADLTSTTCPATLS